MSANSTNKINLHNLLTEFFSIFYLFFWSFRANDLNLHVSSCLVSFTFLFLCVCLRHIFSCIILRFTDLLQLMFSQREDQEPGEGGVLPASHQVASLQSEVGLVPLLHNHQASIGGSFPSHVLVSCESRNHWPTIQHQADLEECKGQGLRKANYSFKSNFTLALSKPT